MFGTLVQKELKAIIQSPKFVGSFAVCSILILLSIYTGVREYKTAMAEYETATSLVNQQLSESTSWSNMSTKAYRKPDAMQIFVSGLSYDLGRWSTIDNEEGVKLRHSAYADDPIFAVFRFIDFAFIVMFVLSLIAIQFTYDAVNGEREAGTLKLVFSNAVPRAKYLLAKCTGAWLGLVLPLSVPVLLGLLLVLAMGVPLTGVHWVNLGILMGLSVLLFTFFMLLGLLVSTVLRHSSVSFLVALLVWVAFVMIIPRAGVMAAGKAIEVTSVAELEAERDAFANERWTQFYNDLSSGKIIPPESHSDFNLDSAQQAIQSDVDQYEDRLREEFRQKKIGQEMAAWSLSRLSPAAAYQLAAMALAESDTDTKTRYEDAMASYRRQFNQYVEAKSAEAGQTGGIRIEVSMDENGKSSLSVDASRDRSGLDVSDVPRFSPPPVSLAESVAPVVLDFGIICFDIILVFALAFVAFLKFDVR
jgi:ABC-type transport system involved in multi-copper enzyme maturation permease subunit